MMGWLIIWTSQVLGKFKVHPNGRTSYEMCTGHRTKHEVDGFGEKLHFNFTTDKANNQKSVSDWSVGYFLGIVDETTAYIVGNDTGIYKVTTIRRMVENEDYDKQCLKDMMETVHDYYRHGARSKHPGDLCREE